MRKYIYPDHDELIHLLQYEIRMPEALNEAITTLRGISEAMLKPRLSRLRIMKILENYKERYKFLIKQQGIE